MVHDFYIEELPGILERYEASRAQFSTYLYAAFLRFARPRLVRNIRWKSILVPFDQWIERHAAAAYEPHTDVDTSALEQRLARAWAALPKSLKAVLDARMKAGESERATAARLGLTRYAVRQRMSEALGRLAVAIGHDDTIRADLRPLALRLWRDGHSLMQVAKDLGLRREQARAKFNELLQSLSAVAALSRD